jgi:HK97 gp10 family phage protein
MAGLQAYLNGLEDAIDVGVDIGADLIVDLAQQIAPVDEGDFKASIEKRDGATKGERQVVAGGPAAPHGIHVEYGTIHSPAQPTLTPASAAIDVDQEIAAQLDALARKSGL